MKKKLLTFCSLCLLIAMTVSCGNGGKKGDNGSYTDNTQNGITQKEDTANGVQPEKTGIAAVGEKDESLDSLKELMENAEASMGIAYLGYTDGTFEEIGSYLDELGFCDKYGFVRNIGEKEFFGKEYGELYLVVPARDDIPVEVYETAPDFETLEINRGKLLGKSENGRPFLVRGEASEVISSIMLVTGSTEYCPILSGMDGMLITGRDVFDFSPYAETREYLGIQPDISDGADPIFCGSWLGEAEDGNYELMAMSLSLYVDGSAEYLYGYGNSEPVEYFTGEWSYDGERDMILLDLDGGVLDEGFDVADPYKLQCGFKWDMDYRENETYLILVHEEGDPILFGKNGATFEFVGIIEPDDYYEDYSYLYATWAKISERVETYLELFEDGSANFIHTDIDGNSINCRGTWFADGLTLYLDLYDSEESPELIYSGEYGIMYDGEMLTLSCFDGDALTDFMEDEGYDSFIHYAVG